jgi:hypothetical protein
LRTRRWSPPLARPSSGLSPGQGVDSFIGKSDADLLDAYIRLLKLLDTPKEARFLSALIKREMIFYLLSGDSGHFFFQQVLFDQQADGVGKAIAWIKEHGDAIVTRPIVWLWHLFGDG